MTDAHDRSATRHVPLGAVALVLLVSGVAWSVRSAPPGSGGDDAGLVPAASTTLTAPARSTGAQGAGPAAEHPGAREQLPSRAPAAAGIAPGVARAGPSRGAGEPPQEGGAQLRGEVHDDLGRPVHSFTLHWTTGHLAQSAFGARELAVEDDAGRFALDVPAGGLWLWISADGHVTSAADWLRPTVSAERRWTLVRTASVRGAVLDSAGAPVAEARITCAPVGTTRDASLDDSLQADAEGRFVVPLPPEGFELAAHAPGYAWSEPRVVDGSPGAEVRLTLELRTPGRIEGVVRGEEDRPLVSAKVWLEDRHARPSEVAADGSFFIADVVPGTHRIGADLVLVDAQDASVHRTRSITTELEVLPGETTHVVLASRSADPIEIIGRVHSGGAPAEGRVSLHPEFGRYALSDVPLAEGRFTARVDGPGIYLVQVTLPTGVLYQRRVVIPNEPTFEVEITLSEASIAGVVVDAAGEPASGVSVQLGADVRHADLAGDASAGRIVTDAEGRFAFEHVRPGVYSLTYPAGAIEGDVARERLRDLDVRDGDARDDLVLRLREAGTVRGVVRRGDGRAVVGATVFVVDEQGLPLAGGADRTGVEGRFHVERVRPGPVRLVAFMPGAAAVSRAPVDVPSGGVATVDLELADAGEIAVTVHERSAGGTRSVGAALRLIDDSGIDFALLLGVARSLGPDGEEVLAVDRVPPGTYLLRALNHNEGHVEREVRVHARTTSEARLVFE